MNSALKDFQTRSKEVEGYFQFVLRLAAEDVKLRHTQSDALAFSTEEHEELLKTLKATCYLLLYNLVESTMRNAIEAIFDELQTKGVHFDSCREELRKEILKNFKKRDVERLLPRLISLARDVVFETFERSEMFSGNLDALTIRKTAKRFGFIEPAGNKFWMLQTVKDLRNDLAHGVKSFADVGRNASPSDLEEARAQTVRILTETLQNINIYLQNADYLVKPVIRTS
jgi:MAE_28990/MAE_18760-like HEPN